MNKIAIIKFSLNIFLIESYCANDLGSSIFFIKNSHHTSTGHWLNADNQAADEPRQNQSHGKGRNNCGCFMEIEE